jgi:hypothetical protein
MGAVPDKDKAELVILHNAAVSCTNKYKEDPTAANGRDWDDAKRRLQDTIDRLWSRYVEQEERFDNRKAVLEYLNENGYSVSQGKLYADAKKGLLRLQPDKSVLMSSVEAYIKDPESGLVKHAEVGAEQDNAERAERKSTAELNILEGKATRQKFDLDREMGRYLLREDFELELASRAAVLETGFKHRIKTDISEWIQVCKGSQAQRAELLGLILLAVDQQLNEFATTDKFQVMFLAEEVV